MPRIALQTPALRVVRLVAIVTVVIIAIIVVVRKVATGSREVRRQPNAYLTEVGAAVVVTSVDRDEPVRLLQKVIDLRHQQRTSKRRSSRGAVEDADCELPFARLRCRGDGDVRRNAVDEEPPDPLQPSLDHHGPRRCEGKACDESKCSGREG